MWVDVAYDGRDLVTSLAHRRTDASTTEAVLTATYAYAAGRQTAEELEFFDDDGLGL